jgi:hypothetical protein
MTAGRKPLSPATLHGPDFVTETPPDMAAQEAQARALVRSGALTPAEALAKDLSYDGALTVDSLEEEIKFYQRRSVEAVLETGKRLLLLKEIAGHGVFHEKLEALGFSPRLAQQFMAATLKVSNTKSTSLLALPNLGQTKLLELLVLDDGEIEALNSGEEVRGIQLDDVDCMTVSELRRALRKEQTDKEAEIAKAKSAASGQIAAKDRLLAEKTARIAELVEEKNRREGMTDSERAVELQETLGRVVFDATAHLIPVRQAVHRIRDLDCCPLALSTALENALNQLIAEINDIAATYSVPLSVTFDWMESDGTDPEETGSDWVEQVGNAAR